MDEVSGLRLCATCWGAIAWDDSFNPQRLATYVPGRQWTPELRRQFRFVRMAIDAEDGDEMKDDLEAGLDYHFGTAAGWPQTRDEVERASNDALNDFMGMCQIEPADFGRCLACYAYKVIQDRAEE